MGTLWTLPAAAQQDAADTPEFPIITVARNVDCTAFELDDKSLTSNITIDSGKRSSTVLFHADVPDTVILHLRYDATLLWKTLARDNRKPYKGELTVYGSDTGPITFTVPHKDFYTIDAVALTHVQCDEIQVELAPEEPCPDDAGEAMIESDADADAAPIADEPAQMPTQNPAPSRKRAAPSAINGEGIFPDEPELLFPEPPSHAPEAAPQTTPAEPQNDDGFITIQ